MSGDTRAYSVDMLIAATVWAETPAEARRLAAESMSHWDGWTFIEFPARTAAAPPSSWLADGRRLDSLAAHEADQADARKLK